MQTRRWRIYAATAAWTATLGVLFILFAGESSGVDWIAAGACGVVAAALTVPLTSRGLFELAIDPRWLALLPGVVKQIFVDFWIITARLVTCVATGRRSTGVFVARREFPTGGKDPEGSTWRAFVTVAATFSPNSYVIDIEPETGNRLSHDLVPNRASELPA